METSYHRHDISDAMWALLEPHLPGQRGQWGRDCPGQPAVHQRGVLGAAYRRALAGPPPA